MARQLTPQQLVKQQRGVVRAKSEFFRTARYGLTVTEHRIVYYAILRGQQEKKPFSPVTVSIKDFMTVCDLKGGSSYNYIKNITGNLVKRNVEFAYKDDAGFHFKQAPWVISVDYHLKEGTITISPNPELKLLFDGKPYTDTEFYFLIKFKCQYSERMYEIFNSFAGMKEIIDFNLSEIRARLSLRENQYKNYNMLKQRVLEPAIEELNHFTDLEISLVKEQKISHGKVDRLFFVIKKKNIPKLYDRLMKTSEPALEGTPPLSEEQQEIILSEMMEQSVSEIIEKP